MLQRYHGLELDDHKATEGIIIQSLSRVTLPWNGSLRGRFWSSLRCTSTTCKSKQELSQHVWFNGSTQKNSLCTTGFSSHDTLCLTTLRHYANASASHAFLKFVNSLDSPECSPYQEAKYTRPSQKHASQPCLPIHCQLRPHTDKCPGSNRIDCRLLHNALLLFAGPVCTLQSTQPPLVCSVVRVLRQ